MPTDDRIGADECRVANSCISGDDGSCPDEGVGPDLDLSAHFLMIHRGHGIFMHMGGIHDYHVLCDGHTWSDMHIR